MLKPRVISISTQKGGVGKTTTTTEMGNLLGKRGYNVLVIDCCQQMHLSKYAPSTPFYGIEDDDKDYNTLMELLKEQERLSRKSRENESCILPKELLDTVICPKSVGNEDKKNDRYFDMILSSIELSRSDKMFTESGDMFILDDVFASIEEYYDYDYILLDINPMRNILYIMTLVASDYVISPVSDDEGGIDGVLNTYDDIRRYREEDKRGNRYTDAVLLGILLCGENKTTSSWKNIKEVVNSLADKDNDIIKDDFVVGVIPQRQDLKRARTGGYALSSVVSDKNEIISAYNKFIDDIISKMDELEREV